MNNKQRLGTHENIFHKLFIARLSFNHDRVMDILSLIYDHGFAATGNNGVQTEYEIKKAQDKILLKLDEL